MKQAGYSLLFAYFAIPLILRYTQAFQTSRQFKALICLIVLGSFSSFQIYSFAVDKPLNHFEKLDLTNSWPNPISVKKKFLDKINQIAQESEVKVTRSKDENNSTDSTIGEALVEDEVEPPKKMSAKEYRKKAKEFDKLNKPKKENQEEDQFKKDQDSMFEKIKKEMNKIKKMQNKKKRKAKAKAKAKKEREERPPLTEAELKIEKKKTALKEIYDCLMFNQCLIQYGKYGSYIPLEQMAQFVDVRVAQQVFFYFIFALLTQATSKKDQMQGVSFSRAVSIVFLMNEVDQLVYYQAKIDRIGQDSDQNDVNVRIDFIDSMFPDTWCVFEKIIVQRIVFFFIYNMAIAISEIYREMKNEQELEECNKCYENQKLIQDMTKQIYNKVHNEEFTRKPFSGNSLPMDRVKKAFMGQLRVEARKVNNNESEAKARCCSRIWGVLNGMFGCLIFGRLFQVQVWPFFRQIYLQRKFGTDL